MTTRIEIYGENAAEALAELRGLSAGLFVGGELSAALDARTSGAGKPTAPLQAAAAPAAAASEPSPLALAASAGAAPSASPSDATKPKAETAKERKAREAAEKKDREARQISDNPENRANPADEAQDAEDDTAAGEAVTGSESKLTHDDVRNALGGYVKKYGMEMAQVDGPATIERRFGKGKVKVSDIPDTQEDLAQAVADVHEMIAKNPYKRTAVA